MDPLSDVLSLLNVASVLSARLETGGRWALRFPGYRHVKFGVVYSGSCWITVDGAGEPVRLAQGDCYLLANGSPYRLADDPATPAADGSAAFARAVDGVTRFGEGRETVLIGGGFTFDDAHAGLLLDILPPLIRLRAASDSAPLLGSALRLLALETAEPRPGAAAVADGLARFVLVQALREHSVSREYPAQGWLGALADPQIGAALKLMHQDPAHPWTVGELARAVDMARSNFALRFKALVGRPPLEYLLRWRLQAAGQALRTTDQPVASIAVDWGYSSESAFSNAFQRVNGTRPSHYRAAARRATAAG